TFCDFSLRHGVDVVDWEASSHGFGHVVNLFLAGDGEVGEWDQGFVDVAAVHVNHVIRFQYNLIEDRLRDFVCDRPFGVTWVGGVDVDTIYGCDKQAAAFKHEDVGDWDYDECSRYLVGLDL